jgi:hypothetical protein
MRSAIDYRALMSDDELSEGLFLRISKADKEQLDAMAERLPLKAAAIARIALRIGLQAIEKDPGAIFAAGKPAKRGGRS